MFEDIYASYQPILKYENNIDFNNDISDNIDYFTQSYNRVIPPEMEESKLQNTEQDTNFISKQYDNQINYKKKNNKTQKKTQIKQSTNHIYKDKSKWVTDLRNAYKKAGITNENALKMLIAQDALESGWGKSAQGKFNYGNLTTGSSWKGAFVNGKDHDANGNPITNKFRSYNSIDEYASDKIQFLTRLYDFNQNDSINTFTFKLQGGNRGKRKYAGSRDYISAVTKIYNNM